MSRLNNLIHEMCRGGVDTYTIGSLITKESDKAKNNKNVKDVYVVSNKMGLVKSEDYRERTLYSDDTSNYTVIKRGMIAYNPSRLNVGSLALMKDDAGLISPMYVAFSINQEIIMPEYLYLFMKSQSVLDKIEQYKEVGARFRFNFSRWDWIEIPVPPLPVQEEIVRILDLYNTKKTELILNLTKEQNFRNKQYRAYRDKLLAFDASVAKSFAVQNLIDNGLITTVTPSFKLKKNEFKANGNIPIISQELEFISGYCDVCDERIGNHNYICFGDHSEHIKYVDFTFVQGADGLKIMYTDENKLSSRYFYHAMNTYYNRHDNYERHFKYFVETKIPLPSLGVQKRIVHTLDNFDKICTDLNIGLPAEIEARQKEYEFYRNELLSFDYLNAERRTQNAERRTQNAERRTQNAERRTGLIKLRLYVFGCVQLSLKDVCKIKNGSDWKLYNKGDIPVYGSGGIITHIDTFAYDKPTVLIPRKGSVDKLYYTDQPFWNVDTIFYTVIDEQIIIPKYLFYLLQSKHLEQYNKSGGVPSLTQDVLNRIVLDVPSLEEQRRIVSILDKFNKLCNDFASGIPAEIEAVQNAYEYYRNRLLNFA